MSDVFISYSRKDKEFVLQLHSALAKLERDVWVDWEDIPATADWWREIEGGIDAADTFVFVITPDSLGSDVCRREIDYAITNNKRFVPVLRREADPGQEGLNVHPAVNSHNWIYFREVDVFDNAFKTLIDSIDTDLSYVREHTRLLVRAREWERNGSGNNFLLTGGEFRGAEAWLATASGKHPPPTELHERYILASRAAENRRQRLLLYGVSIAFLVALSLAIFGLTQSRIAGDNAATAQVRVTEVALQAATAHAAEGTAVFQANRAEENAQTAQANYDLAQSNFNTAQAAQGTAVFEANANATAQIRAQSEANSRATQQSIAVTAQIQAEFNAELAERNALTATFAQGDALNQAATAQAAADANATAQAIAQNEAYANATAQFRAQREADSNATAQAVAVAQAAIATMAQGDALNQAATAIAAADANATAQAVAQSEAYANATAQQQAEINAQEALNSAITATFAQGEALYQAATAIAAADANATAQAIAQSEAYANATAQFRAQSEADSRATQQAVAVTAQALAEINAAEAARQAVAAQAAGETAVFEAARAATQERIAQNSAVTAVAAQETAVYNEQQARAQALASSGEQLLDAGNPDIAIALALEASELNPSLTQAQRLLNRAAPFAVRLNMTRAQRQEIETYRENGRDRTREITIYAFGGLFSPDARLFVTSPDGPTLAVWNTVERRQILTLSGHNGWVTAAAFSPDGRYLASGDETGMIIIRDMTTSDVVQVLNGHTGRINALAYSPTEPKLVSGGADRRAILWDLNSGGAQITLDSFGASVDNVFFSPNGQAQAYAVNQDQPRLGRLPAADLNRPYSNLSAKYRGYSPDGRLAYTDGNENGFLRLWNASQGTLNFEFRRGVAREDYIMQIAFSPDGRFALVHSEGRSYLDGDTYNITRRSVELWRMIDGGLERVFETGELAPDEWNVFSLAFSPDSQTALVGGLYGRIYGLSLYDVTTGKELRRFTGHNRPITEAGFSRDGNYAYSIAEGNVRLWDISERESTQIGDLQIGGTRVGQIGFSPDGGMIYGQNLSAGAIGVWNARDNSNIITPFTVGSSPLAFNPLQASVLVASSARATDRSERSGVYDEDFDKLVIPEFSSVVSYDLATGAFLSQDSVRMRVQAMAYSANGQTVIFGGSLPIFAGDGTAAADKSFLIVWDTVGRQVVSRIMLPDSLQGVPITRVALSPDSQLAASVSRGEDDTQALIIWNTADGTERHRLIGFSSPVNALAFDPNGRTLVAALGQTENGVIVWDAATGDQLLALIGHKGAVNAMAFSPDGETMLTASDDQTLILWDMSNGQPLRRFTGHTDKVVSVAFSQDGRLAISASNRDNIFIWRIESLEDTVNWIEQNREIITLTCPQRSQYNVKPLCLDGIVPTLTPTGTLLPTLTPTITLTPTMTYTPSPTPVPMGQIRTSNGAAANVRSGPGEGFSRIGQVADGQMVVVLDSVSEVAWVQIQLDDGTPGWVLRAVIELAQ